MEILPIRIGESIEEKQGIVPEDSMVQSVLVALKFDAVDRHETMKNGNASRLIPTQRTRVSPVDNHMSLTIITIILSQLLDRRVIPMLIPTLHRRFYTCFRLRLHPPRAHRPSGPA